MQNLRGGHKRECWYRPRSSATVLIGSFAQRLPSRVTELRLQSVSLKAGATQFERLFVRVIGNYAMQGPLDERAQCDAFACGALAGGEEQRIGNLNRGLHGRAGCLGFPIWLPISTSIWIKRKSGRVMALDAYAPRPAALTDRTRPRLAPSAPASGHASAASVRWPAEAAANPAPSPPAA